MQPIFPQCPVQNTARQELQLGLHSLHNFNCLPVRTRLRVIFRYLIHASRNTFCANHIKFWFLGNLMARPPPTTLILWYVNNSILYIPASILFQPPPPLWNSPLDDFSVFSSITHEPPFFQRWRTVSFVWVFRNCIKAKLYKNRYSRCLEHCHFVFCFSYGSHHQSLSYSNYFLKKPVYQISKFDKTERVWVVDNCTYESDIPKNTFWTENLKTDFTSSFWTDPKRRLCENVKMEVDEAILNFNWLPF